MNIKRMAMIIGGAVVVGAAAFAFIPSSDKGGGSTAVAQTPPVDQEYGYLDQTHRTYIVAQWNPAFAGFGGVVVSIDGLGAAWTSTGLQAPLPFSCAEWRGLT